MKRILLTYEDVTWEGESEEPTIDGGYYSQTLGALSSWKSDNELWDQKELDDRRDAATINVEDMVECYYCCDILYPFRDTNLWINSKGFFSGENEWMDSPSHVHAPEKDIYELFVEILNEWGCREDCGNWWSSEHYTADYRTGRQRSYSVHLFDEDWTTEDLMKIDEAIERYDEKVKNRLRNLRQFQI
jgi:hypothetical protein